MQQTFRGWTPIEVFRKADPATGKSRLAIRGIASTEHFDLQGDQVLQDGLDFDPLLKRGFFNDNHAKGTGADSILGYPTKIEPIELDDGGKKVRGTLVEGWLLDTEEAERIAKLAVALRGTPRSLGLSLEGDITGRDQRDNRRVVRGVVRNIAITSCPVNPHTSFDLVKSFRALQALGKSMTAGSGRPAPGVAVAGALAPLMPQSLGGLTRSEQLDVGALGQLAADWRAANGGI